MTKTLPDTLHELLEMALRDVARAEADPDVIVDMNKWQAQYPGEPCLVCAAGAIARYGLGSEFVDHMRDRKEFRAKLTRNAQIYLTPRNSIG